MAYDKEVQRVITFGFDAVFIYSYSVFISLNKCNTIEARGAIGWCESIFKIAMLLGQLEQDVVHASLHIRHVMINKANYTISMSELSTNVV
jgi:hypothetical protein